MIEFPDTIELKPVAREADFKSLWLSTSNESDLVARAFHTGLLADRLSWLFIAAYQSAQRKVFDDLPADEWWSFAASEDQSGELPGLQLEAGRLNGVKTWVATCSQVDRVIVTANHQCFIVDPSLDGALIEQYPPGRFLPDMSVGKITLTDVPAGDAIQMHGNFGLAEPLYMMAAACGYLLRESTRLGLDDFPDQLASLTRELTQLEAAGHESNLPDMFDLYQQVSSLGKVCAAAATSRADYASADWEANGKLLSLYKRAIASKIA